MSSSRQREGAEESDGFVLAIGSGAGQFLVILKRAVWSGSGGGGGGASWPGRLLRRLRQKDERIGAAGEVGGEVEARARRRPPGRDARRATLRGLPLGAECGECGFDLGWGKSAEPGHCAAGADGGEKFAGVLSEDEDVDAWRAALRGP